MKQQNNIYRIDKFPTQDRSCLELSENYPCPSVKTKTVECWKKSPNCTFFKIFERETIFLHIICISWNRLSKTQ